jgi:hypothetical protein
VTISNQSIDVIGDMPLLSPENKFSAANIINPFKSRSKLSLHQNINSEYYPPKLKEVGEEHKKNF